MKQYIGPVLALAGIVILIIVLVNLGDMFTPKNAVDDTPKEDVDLSTIVGCAAGYDIEPETIIFIHSLGCPHCRDMMPIVEELEKEGYKFYWAEGSKAEAAEVMQNCLSSLMNGYVPQFICPNTGEEHTGAMSEADLRKFSDRCR